MLIDRRDIAQMHAGPEIDALVAEVIGGQELYFSTSWFAAGEILDWCHEHDISVRVYTLMAWWSSFQQDRGALVQGWADTGPLAVCRGFLLFVRAGGAV